MTCLALNKHHHLLLPLELEVVEAVELVQEAMEPVVVGPILMGLYKQMSLTLVLLTLANVFENT